jgi:hypothetical protein
MSKPEDLAKISILKLDLPFAINLADGPYLIKMDDIGTRVTINRENVSKKHGVPDNVTIPDNTYLHGDRWGKIHYSRIIIEVAHSIYIRPNPLLIDSLVSLSVEIINRILDICRAVLREHYPRLARSDITSYEMFYVDLQNQTRSSGFGMFSDNILSSGGAEMPNSEQLSQIKTYLERGIKFHPYYELLLNAYDKYYYGDYKIAVVEANSAFEVFIDYFLNLKYTDLGKSESQIINILQTGFKNLLKIHIKVVTGFDFETSPYYGKWENLSYKLRNDIVHEGKNTSAEASRLALETISEIIEFIRSKA